MFVKRGRLQAGPWFIFLIQIVGVFYKPGILPEQNNQRARFIRRSNNEHSLPIKHSFQKKQSRYNPDAVIQFKTGFPNF
ncbi:MAG: hypothetical protein CM15mP47_4370 [Methanobacteriota archaeon]|nr:MAG: hypothetical protein CM15mP47_4370 [Euryarchaeota archaeon]